MKAQSDNWPEKFSKSNGKTQFNYNIQAVEKTDEHGTRTIYEYDYVEIEGEVTRNKLIEALIRTRYRASDELALSHNNAIGKDTTEYTDFQAYRTQVKAIVDA